MLGDADIADAAIPEHHDEELRESTTGMWERRRR
jgi:hypothetical protein